MGAVVHLAQVRQQQDEERGRAVGSQASEERGQKLTMSSAGKTFEEGSARLLREGRPLMGAVLAEVLRSRGAQEAAARTQGGEECGRS